MKLRLQYRRARQAAWRKIADETVVLDLEGKRMYGLNPAAARVWLALDAVADLDQLVRTAAGEPPAFGEAEVVSFLDQLAALGLARPRPTLEAVEERASPGSAPPDPGDSEDFEPPAILWQEAVEQIAGTCAMFPSTSPICDQAPFS